LSDIIVDPQISVNVTVHGDQVVQHFNSPREYVAFQAEEAIIIGTRLMALAIEADETVAPAMINLAMGLIDHAYEQRGDLKPMGGAVKHELIERHRKTLTKRVEVVLNSTREKRKVSTPILAKELVEVCLKEVFS
jgi:hypothetical protein